MPRFPGCEDLVGTQEEKQACAEQKLLRYIYDRVKFTPLARENRIEGLVILTFVVDRNGEIKNPEILRDPGGRLGEQVLNAVNSMNALSDPWTPGMQSGRAVNVRFNLPIRFKLE
nr:energy transducer TonB [Saprospiraceae bacterium]